jgi:hypothetical protein
MPADTSLSPLLLHVIAVLLLRALELSVPVHVVRGHSVETLFSTNLAHYRLTTLGDEGWPLLAAMRASAPAWRTLL